MDIELIEARPGAVPRPLLRPYAPNFQHLAWSPDGKLVAFLQGLEAKYSMYMHDELWVVPAAGGRGARTHGQARSLDLRLRLPARRQDRSHFWSKTTATPTRRAWSSPTTPSSG